MSRRLYLPLVGACLLLTGPSMVRGQGYYPPPFSPPAVAQPTPTLTQTAGPPTFAPPAHEPAAPPHEPAAHHGDVIESDHPPGHHGPDRGPAGNCQVRSPYALPLIGDFAGIRYRRLLNAPVTRTVTYSLANPDPLNPVTVGLAPPRSGSALLPGAVSVDGGPAAALVPGVANQITLAPGSTAVVTGTGTVAQQISVLDFVAARAGVKISDFDSARPRDRFYFGYTQYNNTIERTTFVPGPGGAVTTSPVDLTAPEISSSQLQGGALFTGGTLTDAGTGILVRDRARIHREIVGFECTYEFGGVDGSFGMRLPVFQVDGAGSYNDVGDLTLIWKTVLCGGFDTEDLVSAGLVVSLPTGPKLVTPRGNINSVLLQPWLGYIWNLHRFYVQGFHGAVIPTESRDTAFAFNTVALGYYLYEARKCDPWIDVVALQLEGHLTTPFNQPNANDLIVVNNTFVVNAAVHIGLFEKALLTVGAGTPVGGYRPYEIQGSALLSLYF